MVPPSQGRRFSFAYPRSHTHKHIIFKLMIKDLISGSRGANTRGFRRPPCLHLRQHGRTVPWLKPPAPARGAQVERCKAVIRDAVKAIEEAGGRRAIPAAAFDDDGGVGEADIFCAACDIDESTEVGSLPSGASAPNTAGNE